jgi:hypothetical protein
MKDRAPQSVLDETLITRLAEWIEMRRRNRQPPALKQTRLFMADMCEISIAKTTLHDVVQRIPQMYTYSVSPIDTARMNLDNEDIHTWFLQS